MPLNAVTKNQPYLRNGRPTNFRLGIRMEYDNRHYQHANSHIELKAVCGSSSHRLHGVGTYYGDPNTGHTACLNYVVTNRITFMNA